MPSRGRIFASELEPDCGTGSDRTESARTMAVRATGEAIVARAVGRALLVLGVEHAHGREHVGCRVDDATDLQRENE